MTVKMDTKIRIWQLWKYSSSSIGRIAKHFNLSHPTVAKIVNEWIEGKYDRSKV